MKLVGLTIAGTIMLCIITLGMITIYSGIDMKQLFVTLFTVGWIASVINALREE